MAATFSRASAVCAVRHRFHHVRASMGKWCLLPPPLKWKTAGVEDLESELESVRASAKKDRDFQKQRIAALVARVAALESV